MKSFRLFCLLIFLSCLTGCAEAQFGAHVAKQFNQDARSQGGYKIGKPYLVEGQEYYPQESFDYSETGIASWYGPGFHGKRTANGELFDQNELTAAHKTLQMPSLVRVTNLDNGRSLVLRVNDRGPYSRGRLIDVSSKAAELLGFKNRGTAKVRVDVLANESRRIAEDARLGKDTRGYEVALNNRGNIEVAPVVPGQPDPADTVQTVHVASVESEELPPVTGHVANDGRFLPNPVVTYQPVTPSNIYVQAGAFGDQSNAQRLSAQLTSIGPARVVPANVGGKSFYRVRIGPFARVEDADAALARAVSSGSPKAMIVVD